MPISIQAEDLFEDYDNLNKEIETLTKFIKALPCCQAPMQECGLERLGRDEVEFIVKEADSYEVTKSNIEKSLSPKMLFYGLNGIGRTEPDGKAKFGLWDRIVNCRCDGAVPLGWRGTVVGLVPESKGIFTKDTFLVDFYIFCYEKFVGGKRGTI